MYDVNKNTAPDNILKLFSRISSVHNTIHVPQRLNIFILKNLDSMSNEMLFLVLGSKSGMGYLKFLKKDRKKLLKDHLKQCYLISFKLKTPILMWIRLL